MTLRFAPQLSLAAFVAAACSPHPLGVAHSLSHLVASPVDFTQQTPGATFSLSGFNVLSYPSLGASPEASAGAGVEMYSDCPETVSSSGVLYDQTVSGGLVRVYVYHETSGATRKYSVVLTNTDGNGAQVTIARAGIGGPNTNYPDLGKAALARFLASSGEGTVQVPASGHVLLDATLDGTSVPSGQVINAIYDLQVTGNLKISVVTVQAGVNTLAAYPSLNLEANDGKNRRGTFAPSDLDFPVSGYDTASGPASIDLTDNSLVAAAGVDGTPSSQLLAGQYGILSHVKLNATASDGAQLAFFLAPRGGDLETAAAVGGSVVNLPSASGAVNTSNGIYVGSFNPTAGEIDFDTSLGGGSSGPFRLVLFPYGATRTASVTPDAGSNGNPAIVTTAGNSCTAGDNSTCAGSSGNVSVVCSADGVCLAALGTDCSPGGQAYDNVCNGGSTGEQEICSSASHTCISGCHADSDCPTATPHCDEVGAVWTCTTTGPEASGVPGTSNPGVSDGQSCDAQVDTCSDASAACQTNTSGATVCCISDGTTSTAGDGSDCCTGTGSFGSDGVCGDATPTPAGPTPVATGQGCNPASDMCADSNASCAAGPSGANVCCYPDGTQSQAAGADCCSGAGNLGADGVCGDANSDPVTPSPVADGQACNTSTETCADPNALCAQGNSGTTLCCIPAGNPSTAGDGSDCCASWDAPDQVCGA